MLNFLVFIDNFGLVKDIKWSSPIYLIPKLNINLVDIITENHQENFIELLRQCKNGELVQSTTDYLLKNFEGHLRLWVYKREEGYLVFGYQDKGCSRSQIEDPLKRCIMSVAQEYNEEEAINKDTVREQFDEIQRLNNELVNTRRLLEKANIKLKRMNQDLKNKLVRDELTGLVSRYQFRSEMEEKIKEHPDKYGLFLYIDIDDFKSVNDLYGHSAGDEFLITFSNRLKCLSIRNTVAIRIAGDEFGLFIYGLKKVNIETYEKVWVEIKKQILKEPIDIRGIKLPISISVGMAVYGIDTQNIFELVDYADFAMYHAKSAGKNQFCIFNYDQYMEKWRKNYGKDKPTVRN